MRSCLIVIWLCKVASQPVVAFQGSFAAKIESFCWQSRKRSLSVLSAGKHTTTSDNKALENIYYQNQAWKARKLVEDPEFFYRYGPDAAYSPEFMWIGTSDAKVPPNVLIQEDPQNVFVTRNVANMVVPNDVNQMAALEYAVEELDVKHIIVCGESDCESVRTAIEDSDMELEVPLAFWLQEVRDISNKHSRELDKIKDKDERLARLVELNVIQQCIHVLQCDVVQRKREATYATGEAYLAPLVHGMVFDPKTGNLKRIDVNFEDFASDLAGVHGFRHLKIRGSD